MTLRGLTGLILVGLLSTFPARKNQQTRPKAITLDGSGRDQFLERERQRKSGSLETEQIDISV
jgi:hypothetical protein